MSPDPKSLDLDEDDHDICEDTGELDPEECVYPEWLEAILREIDGEDEDDEEEEDDAAESE